jgi:hypothetical protein
MLHRNKWLKYGVVAAFILASLCCLILALQALCNESNMKAGIATIRASYYLFTLDQLLTVSV